MCDFRFFFTSVLDFPLLGFSWSYSMSIFFSLCILSFTFGMSSTALSSRSSNFSKRFLEKANRQIWNHLNVQNRSKFTKGHWFPIHWGWTLTNALSFVFGNFKSSMSCLSLLFFLWGTSWFWYLVCFLIAFLQIHHFRIWNCFYLS